MNETESATKPDPLKTVADAMEAAVLAAKDGANNARDTVTQMLPDAQNMLARATYNACYWLSYGVVLPAVFVAQSIPKDNALVHGLTDGAQAALDMVNEIKAKKSVGGGPP